MYLLSNEEVQELFHQSVINLRNQAILFLKKIGVNEFSFSLLNDITRLFLLAKIYNAFDLIDETQLKTVLFDNNRLKTYISDFRLKAHHYQDSIRQIVLRGMTIRHENNPKFPSFFNQGNRVYLKINPVSSGMIYVQNLIGEINSQIPIEQSLSVVSKEGCLFIQNLKERNVTDKIIGTRVGRYFKKRSAYLGYILDRLNQPHFQSHCVELFKYLNLSSSKTVFYNNFFTLSEGCRRLFPRALMTDDLFYLLKSNGDFRSLMDFQKRIFELRHFYLKSFQEIHLMQTASAVKQNKKQDQTIDMIILSKSPYDIAAMSVYADYAKNEWGSCLQPDGINSFYLPNEVGYGVFVAFGVNSKDPQKKLARISIKPYLNQSGDVYYGSGFMYGEMMPGVQAQLDAFLKTYQPKEEGIFALHPKVYKDAVGDSYYFNVSAFDIVKHQEFKQIEEQDGYINVGNRVFLKKEERVLDELSLFLENNCEPNKLSVSMNTLPCTADFKQMNVYAEFCAYYLSKEKAKFLPHYANELTLISSNIKNLNSISTDYLELGINLTNAFVSLDGISPICKHVNLSRVNIKVPYFKVPKSLESFTSSLTNWNIQTLDLSEFEGEISFSETDTFYGLKEIKYPKKAKSFNALLTNFNVPIDFDAAAFEKVDFWTGVVFKSFKTGPRLKKLVIVRSVMPEGRLDLSCCEEVFFHDASFRDVTQLILPKSGKIVLKNCVFPDGILLEDVLKNHGFSNPKNIKINTQKPVFKLTQKEREKTV